MASKDISQLSDLDLSKTEKQIKAVTSMLIGALVALLGVSIFTLFINKKMVALLAVPFALSPIVFANLNQLKKIKAEKAKREI